MRQGRGGLLACAIALALLMGVTPVVLGLGPSGPTVGGGKAAVVADYVADGRIDQGHRVDELQAALADRRDDAQFADAVGNKLDEMLLGVHTTAAPAQPPATGEPRELSGRTTFERPSDPLTGASSPSSVLDLPRPSPGEDRPPWPFIALSALAVLLAMTGIGSSVYRRARRAPASGL
ncbi:MAG: hypothetical protein QOD86_944 [Miltoncostaeaceae bacterium]|jgi:hypothetical protein|nr:hypothetical protein [Miltoncostaeaceae bacterium]